MISELTSQKKCSDWGKDLSIQWTESDMPALYDVDGHVQVYHGYPAELGKQHVSRQRLCLPWMMEFWITGFFFYYLGGDVPLTARRIYGNRAALKR